MPSQTTPWPCRWVGERGGAWLAGGGVRQQGGCMPCALESMHQLTAASCRPPFAKLGVSRHQASSQQWLCCGRLHHTPACSYISVAWQHGLPCPALQFNPGHSKALYNRAVARERLRQFETAAEDYGQVLQLDPQNAPACQNRGALWLRLGRLQEAIADLSRAVALDAGAAAAWHARGEAHERLGAIDAALADLQR